MLFSEHVRNNIPSPNSLPKTYFPIELLLYEKYIGTSTASKDSELRYPEMYRRVLLEINALCIEHLLPVKRSSIHAYTPVSDFLLWVTRTPRRSENISEKIDYRWQHAIIRQQFIQMRRSRRSRPTNYLLCTLQNLKNPASIVKLLVMKARRIKPPPLEFQLKLKPHVKSVSCRRPNPDTSHVF